MLFYTLIIFLQIQLIILCPRKSTFEYNEKQLTKVVFNYLNHVDPKSLATVKEFNNDFISPEILQLLRHILSIILEQLSNLYSSELPSEEDLTAKDFVWPLDLLNIENSFETTVCLFVPRCLNFLNMLMDDVSPLFHLYRLHKNLCILRPSLIKEDCTKTNNNSTTYLCDAFSILLLHRIVQVYPEVIMTEDYKERGEEFLSIFFHLANTIDRMEIIIKMNLNAPKKEIFKGVEYDYFVSRGQFSRRNLNDEETEKLNETISQLNREYAVIFDENLDTLEIPDAVSRFITCAFKTAELHFKYKIYHMFNNESWVKERNSNTTIDRHYIGNTMNAIFRKLCKFTPLILVYLTENCSSSHEAETEVLFGLYLTLCNNWMTFLMKHCPKSDSVEDEQNCIVNTILDVLLIKSLYITRDVSDVYDSFLDSNQTKSANIYVERIYSALVSYYNCDNPNTVFPIWTTIDWLTGRHFLVDSHDYSPEMNALKEKPILLSLNNEESALEASLIDVYNMLLPWRLDMRTVMTFHEVFTYHIDGIMDDFVYKHTKCIILYLELVKQSVNQKILKNISKTILWYTEGTNKFRQYLSLPGPYKPIKEVVSDVVSTIKKLKQIKIENLVYVSAEIMKIIPDEKQMELSDWADNEILNFEETEYLTKLNLMLSNNCAKAAIFISIFLSIAHRSKVFKIEETEDVFNKYCMKYVQKVFVDVTHDEKI